MSDNRVNWDIIVRHLSGEITIDEERLIQNWIESSPDNEQFYFFLKNIWDTSGEEKENWNADTAWDRFNDQFDLSDDFEKSDADAEKNKADFKGPEGKGKNRYAWIAVAATAIIVTFGTLGTLFFFDLIDPYNTEKIASEPDFREIITREGQRTFLNLSDGSNIILNAGSTLKIPEMFHADEPRTVFLSGEAYFEVSEDAARPFEVHTEESITHVLGTKFVVTSYPDKEYVQVVVSDGKVALQEKNGFSVDSRIVLKNQKGILTAGGPPVISEVENLSVYLGWTEGKLIFYDDPFHLVIEKLERWYNIDIHTEDIEIMERKLTASFNERQPLGEVLEAVALTLGMTYSKTDTSDTFIFSNNNSHDR